MDNNKALIKVSLAQTKSTLTLIMLNSQLTGLHQQIILNTIKGTGRLLSKS